MADPPPAGYRAAAPGVYDVEDLVRRRHQPEAIQTEEGQHGHERGALVAVDERVTGAPGGTGVVEREEGDAQASAKRLKMPP